MTYRPGDKVRVHLPGGWYTGTVRKAWPTYGWIDEPRYEVKGSDPVPFVTIVSERAMKANHNSPHA